MFAGHGFQNVAEKAKLGRFVITKIRHQKLEEHTLAQRLRMSFEELGPAFIKFGQLLATRPDLIPIEFVEEFKKLHTQVRPAPFEAIQFQLESHFGQNLSEVFERFDEVPLGAASIAQVYLAVLRGGEEVVVKVQRPGIVETIREDLGVLYQITELLERYVPETRPYNPVAMVDEFFKTLELETNFVVEANNMRRFEKNFSHNPDIKIPHVYMDYCGPRVLVMERLKGVPLSDSTAFQQEGVTREELIRVGIRGYLQMVFRDGLFHADLHAGNLFVLPNNQLGLVDFGVVGRLNQKTQDAIASMLVALAHEDYDRLAYEFVDLAPYNEKTDVDVFARELRDLIAPYFGLTTKNVNMGKVLLDSSSIAARHHLVIPSELMLFFKSMVTIEGMGHMVLPDFDILPAMIEFSQELILTRYEPGRIGRELTSLGKDTKSLLFHLPRQVRQFARKINSPDFSLKLKLHGMEDHRRVVEKSSNLIFLGLLISALILSGTAGLFLDNMPLVFSLPVFSVLNFGLAGILSMVAFYHYIKRN